MVKILFAIPVDLIMNALQVALYCTKFAFCLSCRASTSCADLSEDSEEGPSVSVTNGEICVEKVENQSSSSLNRHVQIIQYRLTQGRAFFQP